MEKMLYILQAALSAIALGSCSNNQAASTSELVVNASKQKYLAFFCHFWDFGIVA